MLSLNSNLKEFYAEHLAEVNETNQVFLTENIYNQNGILIAAKGHKVSYNLAKKLVMHKLKRPVEHFIDIENKIDSHVLYMHISSAINERRDLLEIHGLNNLDKPLLAACKHYAQYPILVQKITVLATQLQQIYKRSIMGAWLALGIARQLEDDSINMKDAFLAALVRDIGYLHLPNITLAKKDKLSRTEENAVRCHPIVASLILNEVDSIPEYLSKAVAEHHERCDGAGYPNGSSANNLSLLGQVVAMADEAQHLCIDNSENHCQSMSDLSAFLGLNMNTHFESIYKASMGLVRDAKTNNSDNLTESQLPKLLFNLISQTKIFLLLNRSLKWSLDYLHKKPMTVESKMVIRFGDNIQNALVQSGLLSEEHSRWLLHVDKTRLTAAITEMKAIEIMYQELYRQFEQVIKKLAQLVDKQNRINSLSKHYDLMVILLSKAKQYSSFSEEAIH